MAQDLILFSHLRWNQQPQRPHRVAQAYARRGRVFFVEAPIRREGITPCLETQQVAERLYVCQAYVPDLEANTWLSLAPLSGELLSRHQIQDWIAWLYTPAAVPLLQDLQPRAIVYDCTTEVQNAIQGKPALQQAESELLEVADLVLANSPYLHRLLETRHPQVHCLLDAIDHQHFSSRAPAESTRQAALPRPRLGFFGTIDERLDVELLDRLAQAHPDWQFILVGPVICLEEEWALPQRPNIHYFGREKYEHLPDFLGGWDLCILPLRQGAQSCFTNPARLLELLATGHPVVSTKVAGFQDYFETSARFADAETEFVQACEEALAESVAGRRRRQAGARALLERMSWERNLPALDALLDSLTGERRLRQPVAAVQICGALPVPDRPHAAPETVVLGAGLTGLSAALELGAQAVLLERRAWVGGRCRIREEGGFRFDCSGQVLTSRRADLHNLYQRLLGDNIHWQLAERWIHSHGTYIRYPFHASLHGLPPAVARECLMGMLKARLTAARAQAETPRADQTGGALESTQPLSSRALPFRDRRQQPRNLEDAIYEFWGAGMASRFLVPYNQKFWGQPLHTLDVTALQGTPLDWDLEQAVNGALQPNCGGDEEYFGYPRQGGLQLLAEALAAELKGELRLNTEVMSIDAPGQRLRLADGETLSYRTLVSTLAPLHLLALIWTEVPTEVRQAAQDLRYLSLRRVYLGIGRAQVTDRHWLYFTGETLFHRIFAQGNACPASNVPGGFALTCEISHGPGKPLALTDEEVIRRCIQDCCKVGLLRESDPIWIAVQEEVPDRYLIPDLQREARLEVIDRWLAQYGILCADPARLEPDEGCDQEILLGQTLGRRILLGAGEPMVSA